MLRRWVLHCVALALVSFAFGGVARADTSPEVRLVKIPVAGSPLENFGSSWTDASRGRYYLADRSNKSLDVFDTHTNTLVKQIGGFVGFTGKDDTSGPDGVVSTSHTELWVGDGDSTVKVVDVPSGTITASISTGGKARANKLAYDPQDQLIVVANDADVPPFLTFISVTRRSVIGRVRVAEATGGIGQTVYNPDTRLFYTAIPTTTSRPDGEVRVLNPNIVLAATVPLPSCNPYGLALGSGHQLLVGCNSTSHTLIIDSTNGAVLADLPETGGSDDVSYNLGDGRYYLAESGPQHLGVIDGISMHVVDNAETGIHARSVAVDPSLNHVFVPVAAGDPACPNGCIAVFASVTGDRASNVETP
jgi:hypothetical protein